MAITTTFAAKTPLHACAVAWSPPGRRLAVATYEVVDDTRQGALLVYALDEDDDTLRLEASSADLGGVFDLTWIDDRRCLCALASG